MEAEPDSGSARAAPARWHPAYYQLAGFASERAAGGIGLFQHGLYGPGAVANHYRAAWVAPGICTTALNDIFPVAESMGKGLTQSPCSLRTGTLAGVEVWAWAALSEPSRATVAKR